MVRKEDSPVNQTYIIIAIIIAAAILGFGLLNYMSSQKNQQIEQTQIQQEQQAQQDKLDLEKQQAQQTQQEQNAKKQKLDSCLTDAESNYHEYWYSTCKSFGKISNDCIAFHDMTFDDYAKQNNVPSISDNPDAWNAADNAYAKQKVACMDCLLPQYNADIINKSLADDKALCVKLYGN